MLACSNDCVHCYSGVFAGHLYASHDSGITWNVVLSDKTRIWYGIASSVNGTNVVAVDNYGEIYRTTDRGTNWFRGRNFTGLVLCRFQLRR